VIHGGELGIVSLDVVGTKLGLGFIFSEATGANRRMAKT
jgi:hypothetical protein